MYSFWIFWNHSEVISELIFVVSFGVSQVEFRPDLPASACIHTRRRGRTREEDGTRTRHPSSRWSAPAYSTKPVLGRLLVLKKIILFCDILFSFSDMRKWKMRLLLARSLRHMVSATERCSLWILQKTLRLSPWTLVWSLISGPERHDVIGDVANFKIELESQNFCQIFVKFLPINFVKIFRFSEGLVEIPKTCGRYGRIS